MKKNTTLYVRPMEGYTLDDIVLAVDCSVIKSIKRGDHFIIIKPARDVESMEFVFPSLHCISFAGTSDDLLILRGEAIALLGGEE